MSKTIMQVELSLKFYFWGPVNYLKESILHRVDTIVVIVAAIGNLLEATSVVSRNISAVLSFLR